MSHENLRKSRLLATAITAASLITPAITFTAFQPTRTEAKPTTTWNSSRNARQEFTQLGEGWENWFWLYQVIEKLSRANELDERPWRVGLSSQYEINAFATKVNLVVAYAGILDQIQGDDAALAFVMGHEMGHNVLRHQALTKRESATLLAQVQAEAEQEINREIRSGKPHVSDYIPLPCLPIIGCRRVGDFNHKPNAEQIRQRIEDIKKRKLEEYQSKRNAIIRKQEFQADRQGYFYMATAGYDPQGCFRALDVLARTPEAEFDTDHPNVPARIEAIKNLMQEYPPESLAAKGAQNFLKHSQPLTYDLRILNVSIPGSGSQDLQFPTIRINSKFGSFS